MKNKAWRLLQIRADSKKKGLHDSFLRVVIAKIFFFVVMERLRDAIGKIANFCSIGATFVDVALFSFLALDGVVHTAQNSCDDDNIYIGLKFIVKVLRIYIYRKKVVVSWFKFKKGLLTRLWREI